MIFELWEKTSIPLVSDRTIRRLLGRLLDKYYQIIKKPSKYFEADWSELFRISKCKCKLNSECRCPQNMIISPMQKSFLIDQNGARILSLSQTQEIEECLSVTNTSFCSVESTVFTTEYIPECCEENDIQSEDNNIPAYEEQLKVENICLQNYALALDRTGTSDRYGSLLATTLIKDLKNSIASNASVEICEKMLLYLDGLIIDKNKIRRERAKQRAESTAAITSDTILKCISYDGKKEKTLKKQKLDNEVRLHRTIEEHITIVKEPTSTFLGYVTPINGTGKEIQKAIVNFLNSEGYSLNYLVSINSDGTGVNTGYKLGVNAFLEKYLQRPLQWNICLFHFNELPLKSLLTSLLGKQVGPGIWPGEIGSRILACNKEQVSIFYY